MHQLLLPLSEVQYKLYMGVRMAVSWRIQLLLQGLGHPILPAWLLLLLCSDVLLRRLLQLLLLLEFAAVLLHVCQLPGRHLNHSALRLGCCSHANTQDGKMQPRSCPLGGGKSSQHL